MRADAAAMLPDNRERALPLLGVSCLLAGTAALAFLLSLAYFAWVHYSPIPYLDSWTGYIGFYLDSESFQAWWRQHNEHRILLSKLFFWLDLRYFAGRAVILVVLNFLLLGLAWATLVAFSRRLFPGYSVQGRWLLYCTLALMCFSWLQHDNAASPFQNQFIAAFALPLLALYWLARAEQGRGAFWGALALGVLATFSMISGLFCLPVMAVFSLLRWGPGRRFAICLLTAVLVWGLYFSNYVKGPATDLGLRILVEHTLPFVNYMACYLGGAPAVAVDGKVPLAMTMGYLGLALFAALLVNCLRSRRDPFCLALLGFVGYVVISAGLTSLGRSFMGYDTALVSRYTTPALLMWAALLLLSLRLLPDAWRLSRWVPALAFLAVFLVLLAGQFNTLRIDYWAVPDKARQAALLSYQLGESEKPLGQLGAGEAREQFQRARAARISIFDDPHSDLSALAALLGRDIGQLSGRPCEVRDARAEAWSSASGGILRVSGTLPEAQARRFDYLALGDDSGRVVGLGVIDNLPWLTLERRPPSLFQAFLVGAGEFASAKCLETF